MKTENQRRDELEKFSLQQLRSFCQTIAATETDGEDTKAVERAALICWILAAEKHKGGFSS